MDRIWMHHMMRLGNKVTGEVYGTSSIFEDYMLARSFGDHNPNFKGWNSCKLKLPKGMKAIKVPPSDPPKDITTWMSGTAVARIRIAKTMSMVTWYEHEHTAGNCWCSIEIGRQLVTCLHEKNGDFHWLLYIKWLLILFQLCWRVDMVTTVCVC